MVLFVADGTIRFNSFPMAFPTCFLNHRFMENKVTNTSNQKPNFLVIMSDEHAPMWSSAYGHPFVRTPNMDKLAQQGNTFDAAYCNSPLCVPSRLSFMTGEHVSNCEGWDNATPLESDVMTWPYALRLEGYDCALSGKMHLIGPDKLHGFQDQLAYDPHGDPPENDRASLNLDSGGRHPIFPWEDGVPTASDPWPSVQEACAGSTPMIDADDIIEEKALEYLRSEDRQSNPWALCVGFVAPHFPFVVPEPYFSMYYPKYADLPANPPGHLENLPEAARRTRQALNFDGYSEDEVRRARAAYYGLITYLDDKIGRLLQTLEDQGLLENTVVIHTSDHGESLGEHGLWRKMNFYEQSVRVPLQVSWPNKLSIGTRHDVPVSLVDVTATILDLAEVSPEVVDLMELDGESLVPVMSGKEPALKGEAFSEHLAHGTDRPRAMIRKNSFKLCYSHGDSVGEPSDIELYDLKNDPGEFENLAGQQKYEDVEKELIANIMQRWKNADALDGKIRNSQKSRLFIRRVLAEKAIF